MNKPIQDLIEDLMDTVTISGTVGAFGFDGYYDTDTPETPIDVYITLDSTEKELRAHCESDGRLYSEELGGNILTFIRNNGTYDTSVIDELERWLSC